MKKIPIFVGILVLLLFFANAPSASSLSDEDLRFLKFFQKYGMIPAGMDPSQFPPDKLKQLIELFKTESGVDDIDFAEKPDVRFCLLKKPGRFIDLPFWPGT